MIEYTKTSATLNSSENTTFSYLCKEASLGMQPPTVAVLMNPSKEAEESLERTDDKRN